MELRDGERILVKHCPLISMWSAVCWRILVGFCAIAASVDLAQADVTPQQFVPPGVRIADGQSHPLSATFRTLDDARTQYPFVTSLSNEFAWVGWQMALNQAKINGSIVVSAPSGVYLVHPLYFYSNTTIECSGCTLRLVFVDPPKTSDVQSLLSPATMSDVPTTNFSLAGVELDGNRTEIDWSQVKGDGGAQGLALWCVRGARIRDVTIRNTYTDGIYIVGLRRHFEVESQNLAFQHIRIENCRRQGVTVISGSNLSFGDFVIRDIQETAPGAAFDLEPNGKTEPIRKVSITNLVGDHLRAGILITSLATPPLTEDVTLTNIRLTDITTTHGLAVHNMTGLHVNGYHVEMATNGRYPAIEFASMRGASVKNVVTRNGTYSIWVRSGSHDIDIDGADVAGGRVAGIVVEANTSGIVHKERFVSNGTNRDVKGISNASKDFVVK